MKSSLTERGNTGGPIWVKHKCFESLKFEIKQQDCELGLEIKIENQNQESGQEGVRNPECLWLRRQQWGWATQELVPERAAGVVRVGDAVLTRRDRRNGGRWLDKNNRL